MMVPVTLLELEVDGVLWRSRTDVCTKEGRRQIAPITTNDQYIKHLNSDDINQKRYRP